jgi:hypothetical protein
MNQPTAPAALLLSVVPSVLLLVVARWRLARSASYVTVAVIAFALGAALLVASLVTASTYMFESLSSVRESKWSLTIPLLSYAASLWLVGRSRRVEGPSLVIGACVGLLPLCFLGVYAFLLSACAYGDCI